MAKNIDNNNIDNLSQSHLLPKVKNSINTNINNKKNINAKKNEKKIKDNINVKEKHSLDNLKINKNFDNIINNSTKVSNTNNQNNEVFGDIKKRINQKWPNLIIFQMI